MAIDEAPLIAIMVFASAEKLAQHKDCQPVNKFPCLIVINHRQAGIDIYQQERRRRNERKTGKGEPNTNQAIV